MQLIHITVYNTNILWDSKIFRMLSNIILISFGINRFDEVIGSMKNYWSNKIFNISISIINVFIYFDYFIVIKLLLKIKTLNEKF